MIFIGLFIIIFIVINVQIGRVHNMVAKPPRLDPYHVPQYWMIYFLMKSIHVRRMATWCLHKFPCNTHSHVQQAYLERKWDLVCHIRMLLVSYHPCMASFVQITYPMGVMGVKNQCGLLNVRFHNVFHNCIFDKPMFLHFRRVHVMSCNCCCESPH
jgi:hypothetical protein